MGIWYERALKVRKDMNKVNKTLTDIQISETPSVIGTMLYDGELIENGTPIKWGADIVRAAVNLWDNETNNPDNAPALWEKIMYRDRIRIIPEVITVGLKFSKDELGWWGSDLYKSTMDNNVWTPAEYAQAWELIEQAE